MQIMNNQPLKQNFQYWAEPLALSTLGLLLIALEGGSTSADWVLNIVGTIILAILVLAGMISVAQKI